MRWLFSLLFFLLVGLAGCLRSPFHSPPVAVGRSPHPSPPPSRFLLSPPRPDSIPKMMLLAKEFALSPPAAATPRRRASARVAPTAGGGPPVPDLWLRTAAPPAFGSHSHDSDTDLAMLVTDFLENGAGDARATSDNEAALSDLTHLADNIMVRTYGTTPALDVPPQL